MKVGVLGFAVNLIVLGGCGTFAETTPLNAPPHALSPRPPEDVEVYSSSPPAKAHVDLALIQVDQRNGTTADMAEMVAKVREQAGQMGCDAIFVSGASERAGASGGAHLLDPGSHLLLATCIAYLEPTPIRAALRPAVAAPPASSAAPGSASFVVSSPAHR
jgi:hypothetical protein